MENPRQRPCVAFLQQPYQNQKNPHKCNHANNLNSSKAQPLENEPAKNTQPTNKKCTAKVNLVGMQKLPESLLPMDSELRSSQNLPLFALVQFLSDPNNPAVASSQVNSPTRQSRIKPATVSRLSTTIVYAMRLTAVLAVVFSAVIARPLHELEHSGTVSGEAAAGRPACSCGHLHGHGKPSASQKPLSAVDPDNQPQDSESDGSHSHDSCSICLAFWLQSPFVPVQQFAVELVVQRLANSELLSQCSVHTLCLPPLRGPPAA